MSYATVEELRAYLTQVNTTTADTTLLQAVLDRATDIIDKALGFSFAAYPAASAKVIAHAGGSTLNLPAHQVGTVTVVADNSGSTVLSTTYAEDATGDLYFTTNNYPYGTSLQGLPLWSPGRYTVTAVWGYGPTPPESIVQVCLEVAVNIWRGKDRGMWTEVVGVEGSGGLRFTGGLTNQQRSILAAVRHDLRSGGRVLA
jgi:hypothetical protein